MEFERIGEGHTNLELETKSEQHHCWSVKLNCHFMFNYSCGVEVKMLDNNGLYINKNYEEFTLYP